MVAGVQELRDRLSRYPAERYPAQHAIAQFHLGSRCLSAGETASAVSALVVAERILGELGMREEHAKAAMALGAALRAEGRHRDALLQFVAAGETFAALEMGAEEGASHHNRGLVLVESDDLPEAVKAFATAQELFALTGQRVWAAAAARERATALLHGGEPEVALPLLQEALEQAGEADPAGAGAAANALGLAQLAVDDAPAAVASFQLALAWHPRSVRPADHAMVKANLALAHEAAGSLARARLTAAHALSVPEAAPQVRSLARAVLGRLGNAAASDLFVVLEQEPPERGEIWVRDELWRWVEADERDRLGEARAWLEGQVMRGADGVAHAQMMLGVLLELPPPSYDAVVEALVRATGAAPPAAAQRFQADVCSAMARYPLPQWQRMATTFTTAAERAGLEQQWR